MTTAPPTTPQAFPVAREPMALIEEALDRAYLPRASWMDGDEGGAPSFRVTADGVAILDICGVIDSRASWLWTGYDEVQTLAAQAFAHAGVAAVVLSLDSPGGVAAGMVDAGRSLRAMADRSGKPLVAHAGPMACSAAYGIACAADRILVTEDGTVGSVGCIAVVTDRTAQNAQEGLARKVIASGTMKADGHPDQPLTDAALGRMRARVMQLAQMFGGWVATRRGMTPEAVMALQGGVAYGADAVTKGLADATGTLSDAITTAAAMAADLSRKKTMDTNAAKSLETLASIRTALDVKSDEEAIAAVATLRQRATQADTLAAEVATLRGQITERDTQALAAAREAVFRKHEDRRAFTPGMRGDAQYMADLAPLSPEALDRVLAKLPAIPEAVTPRVSGIDPKSADPESVELTDEDKAFAKAAGLSEEAFLKTKRADAKRAR